VIYAFLRINAVGLFETSVAIAPIQKADLLSRLMSMPAIFYFYIKTFFFPINLATSYQWVYSQIDVSHFIFPIAVDLFFLFSLISLGIIIYKRYSQKYFMLYIFFGIWFLSGILFHLQIIPLDQTVSERWFYFPIVGLLGMIGVVMEAKGINLNNRWILLVITILLITLSIRTMVRSFDWRNDFTLASHDSNVSTNNFDLETELSYSYFEEGRYEDAKNYAQESVRLFPTFTNLDTLGSSYAHMGDYKDATEAYMRALTYGDYYVIYDNLAENSLIYGNPEKNIAFIKNSALKKYPQDPILWDNLALLEYTRGDITNAKVDIAQAYDYDHSSETILLYNAIMSNYKVTVVLKNGQVTILSTKR
jgi:Tfp pilus assembly protein PilF